MVTYGVLERVFRISYNDGEGTCFAVESDGRQYLLTAAHVLAGIREQDEIRIWRGNNWNTLSVRKIGIDLNKDVAVVAAQSQLCYAYGFTRLGPKFLVLSQDVFFLGFPHHLFIPTVPPPGYKDRGYPLPLIKKAIVSGFLSREGAGDILLDGHNNLGFSGGPVIFAASQDRQIDPKSNIVIQKYRVAGIISSYFSHPIPVSVGGTARNAFVHENTGIIQCASIVHAMKMIVANPQGAVVSLPDSEFAVEDAARLKAGIEKNTPEDWNG